jgi:hypothetical protein
MSLGAVTKQRYRAATMLLALALAAGGCFDLSRLRQPVEPIPESPSWDPTIPGTGDDDTLLVDADGDLRGDISFPDLDIPFDALGEFSLAAVEPSQGQVTGGEVIMLVGNGFHEGMHVFFGPLETLDPFVVNSHYATVESPPGQPGPVDVRLRSIHGQEAVLPAAFTYVADLYVASIDPPTGPAEGGTPVLLAGSGFTGKCAVYFAGRLSPGVFSDGDESLQVVTPPGNCGAADVTVECDDRKATLDNGFFYEGAPRIDRLYPKAGGTAGGYLVHLEGRGFTPHLKVRLGETELGKNEVFFLAPTLVDILVPPGLPGPVPLELTTDCGQALEDPAFIYVSEEPEPGSPAITGVLPTSLPACAGGPLTVTVQNLGDVADLQVFIDDEPAPLLSLNEDLGILDVMAPPGKPGAAVVLVTGTTGFATLEGVLAYKPGPYVESVSPAAGSPSGGTATTIAGCALPAQPEVRFGPATAAVTSSGPTQIEAVTPPGSPGSVDVLVVGSAGTATLPNGFTYASPKPKLLLVDPDHGSIAGGTYVRFHGDNLPLGGSYRLGDKECVELLWVDPTLVTARAPFASEPGTVDVSIHWAGEPLILPQAYTYFDPMNKKGGTGGGPVDEALNVTVLDSTTGKGIPAALVIAALDGSVDFSGFTDEKGQITFSAPGLAGPQGITAAKKGYNLYSVVHFDATNVTVYLTPVVLPEYGPWEPTQSWVSGRVYGLDKYVVAPPGNCSKKFTGTILCKSCQTDADCADPVLPPDAAQPWCTDIGDTGRYCVTPCAAPEDCPPDFICAKTSFTQTGCIPKSGEKQVRCRSSKGSMFGQPPDPGPGGIVNQHDIYFIAASPGNIAIVCHGGFLDPDTGQFTPTVMGLHRNVVVLPNQVLKDKDVELSIPLDREARLALHNIPFHPSGIRQPYIIVSLELGKDGFLNPPVDPVWNEAGKYFLLSSIPNTLAGPLFGSSWSMYASIGANTPISIPYSVRMESKVESLAGDGVLLVGDGTVEPLHPPVTGDVAGMDFVADDDILVVTDRGEAFHFAGLGWTPAGIPGGSEGFSSLYRENPEHLWLGGRNGSVWHQGPAGFTHQSIGSYLPVLSLWAAAGKAIAVAQNDLVILNENEVISHNGAPPGRLLRAAWASDLNDIWVLADQGTVYSLSQSGWQLVAEYPSNDLAAISGTGPDDVWIAASPGTVIHWNGDGFETLHVSQYAALNAILAVEPGKIFVAGADGLLLALDPGGLTFSPIQTDTLQDLNRLSWSFKAGRLAAGGLQTYNVGPFMAYPKITSPLDGAYFSFDKLSWGYHQADAWADHHFLILSTEDGFPFWYLVVDGETTEFPLPPVPQELGAWIYPEGPKRMNITSSLAPEFSIDNYSLGDFSIFGKVSWAVDLVSFK